MYRALIILKTRKHYISLFLFLTVLLSSCGSDSSTYLMGGAIQGVPLQLTTTVTTPIGSAGSSGTTDGTGSAARFYNPYGITTDGINLYIADTFNHTIRKIVIATGEVTTLAGSAGSSGSADGTGSAALFNSPNGITTDGTNLYVADSFNHTIRKIIIATMEVTTLAGSMGVSGSADGIGSAAQFNAPTGITTDGTVLYVADHQNHTIRKIVIATGEVTTLAGSALSNGTTNGTGVTARFNFPYGITTDGANIYVTDTQSYTIRKIVITTGEVTTLAGSAGNQGSTDGVGAAARFFQSYGITTDGFNLYVADTFSNTMRQIVIATGEVTTLVGSAGNQGSTDGVGAAARFYNPAGITTDGTNLYILDALNHTVRQMD